MIANIRRKYRAKQAAIAVAEVPHPECRESNNVDEDEDELIHEVFKNGEVREAMGTLTRDSSKNVVKGVTDCVTGR